VRVFSENVSAVKARSEYDAMIAAARRRKFDVLLIWSRDRLDRSMVGALHTVLDLEGVARRRTLRRSSRALRARGRYVPTGT
jgi:DNA invertase Pin-like site-specific DNA recombinase